LSVQQPKRAKVRTVGLSETWKPRQPLFPVKIIRKCHANGQRASRNADKLIFSLVKNLPPFAPFWMVRAKIPTDYKRILAKTNYFQ